MSSSHIEFQRLFPTAAAVMKVSYNIVARWKLNFKCLYLVDTLSRNVRDVDVMEVKKIFRENRGDRMEVLNRIFVSEINTMYFDIYILIYFYFLLLYLYTLIG